jgi:hypothetical protein
VQTFLPYESFRESARVLDRRRLGKQRIEAIQILRINLGLSTPGWANHPAVKMWRDHETWLFHYTRTMRDEWAYRGYRNDATDKHLDEIESLIGTDIRRADRPAWLGDERIHASHRANLVRKMPEYYGRLWPDVIPQDGYVWPSMMEGASR